MSVRLPALPTRHILIRLRRHCRPCRVFRCPSCNSSGVPPSLHLPYHRHRRRPSPPRPHRSRRTRTVHKEARRLDARARHMSLRHVSIASARTSAVTINGPALAVWHLESR
jgi:hypothetical protein